MVGGGKKLNSKSKIDLTRPSRFNSALVPHICQTNHGVALYKREDQADLVKIQHPREDR